MSKKKLEVVELNKKEEQIILKEEQKKLALFWRKYSKLIFLTSLILTLTILIISIFITISNLSSTKNPIIKETSIDTDLQDDIVSINSDMSLTEETAKELFNKNNIFKNDGEVLLIKTVSKKDYIIKFYSDYTALKIMKNENIITRINSIKHNTYGIKENGVISTKAKISDIKKVNSQTFLWGNVDYYSDGSAEITNSKMDMFVRNAKDINENYISNNKVTYLKESKNIKGNKLNYYYDGTIEIIINNKSYILRNEEDINIINNKIVFKNNNEATVKETVKLSDGKIIKYYTDGGALIVDGNKTLSVRKSNSIIIKNNKIYEIVDNIYVTISNSKNNGNIIYYSNGSAIIENYDGKKIYIEENSNIKYKNNLPIITNNYENLTEERKINKEKLSKFETIAVVETEKYIAIVPQDSILYDSDGSVKEIVTEHIDPNSKPITIVNNTNETIRYRLVIENSNRTNLDVEYIRYQLSVGNTYISPKRLDSKIWDNDHISDTLSIKGVNYILLDKTLEPHAKDQIKLMLWTDYYTIPNSMQNKYFYGTIKIYAWQELKNNDI